MNKRTHLIPSDQLKADAEKGLTPNDPFRLIIDFVPTLNGNIQYALALPRTSTIVKAVHPSVVLALLDWIHDAYPDLPEQQAHLREMKLKLQELLESETFREIERRKQVERQGR